MFKKSLMIIALCLISSKALAELSTEEKIDHIEAAEKAFLREAKGLMQGFQALFLKCKEYEAEVKELQIKLEQARQANQELEAKNLAEQMKNVHAQISIYEKEEQIKILEKKIDELEAKK